MQEVLQLVLTYMFYNHALLGCDVGWEWTRYWVWADGWVGGGCREYSMSYLNFDASSNGHLYNSFKIWAAYDSLFFSHLYRRWCIPILVMIQWCFSIWISHSSCINGAHFVFLKNFLFSNNVNSQVLIVDFINIIKCSLIYLGSL